MFMAIFLTIIIMVFLAYTFYKMLVNFSKKDYFWTFMWAVLVALNVMNLYSATELLKMI